MASTHRETPTSRRFQGLTLLAHPVSGTEDDDDDRDDERPGENEALMRAVSEGTETPEEFEIGGSVQFAHAADDDALEVEEDLEDEDERDAEGMAGPGQ